MASYVASAPRNCVGPSTANSAAAKNAARWPNSLDVTFHNRAVAPIMKMRLRKRAPMRPPR